MELALRQKQTQTLQLVMTTELRQAISLLQYSTYELYQFIQEQQYENPFIELIESTQDISPRASSNRVNYAAEDVPNPIDFIANEEKNMFDHLLEQAQWLDLEERERKLLRYLILNVDENAFLPLSTEDIAEQLSICEAEVDVGIQLLQQLEPVGVGARNIAECLVLQVNYYYPDEALTALVIQNDLDALASKKWNELSTRYDLSRSDLQHMYELIRKLDPKPSASLMNDTADYVLPDIVIKEEEGKFIVYLNDSYIPEIRFNRHDLPDDNKLSSYVNEHYKKYQWLMNSIEQRRSTILKITEVLIRKQEAFFKDGFSAIQPLKLNDVAEEIQMHESTVSRATMNKVIQTPKGSFDMRELFASKMEKKDGTTMSQTRVKWLLEDIIKKENKTKPLSDQKIADHLTVVKEITISRRTVAKYREELHIPSSRQRKEITG